MYICMTKSSSFVILDNLYTIMYMYIMCGMYYTKYHFMISVCYYMVPEAYHLGDKLLMVHVHAHCVPIQIIANMYIA